MTLSYTPPGGPYPPQQSGYPPQEQHSPPAGVLPPPQQYGNPPQQYHPPPGPPPPLPQGGYHVPVGPPPPHLPHGKLPPPGQYYPIGNEEYSYPGGYPPHGELPGVIPSGSQQQTAIVTSQPAIVVAEPIQFFESPVALTCSSCNKQIVSVIHYESGKLATLICIVLFCLGCWICCFIPCCVDSMKDVVHHCPSCSVRLGVSQRM